MKLRKISRNGILPDNLMSAVLAIGGLLMLAFLGVKLYNFFVSQDQKNAGAFLDSLQGKIEALDVRDCIPSPQASPPNVQLSPQDCFVVNSFALRGVEGWALTGWGKDDPLQKKGQGGGKPEKCLDNSCLCACPNGDNIAASCQEKGICRIVNYGGVKFGIASSASFYNSLVPVESFPPSISNLDKIALKKILMEIGIKKSSNSVFIYSKE